MKKPKVYKEGTKWILFYYYFPRQFWLFGANKEERQAIAENCHTTEVYGTHSEAIKQLKYLYKQRVIAL